MTAHPSDNKDMKEYEQHEIGKCYPPLSAGAREKLRASLQDVGPKSDVCVFENKILDGWNQYLICKEDSLPCQFAEVNPVDPIAFVVQRNEGRRHLTDDQRAMIAAQLAEIKRQHHGGMRQRNKNSGAQDQVSNSKLDLKKTTELIETAEQQHVSISKASRARRVMKVKPDAVEKIRNGELKINDVVGPLENKGRGKRGGTSTKTGQLPANPLLEERRKFEAEQLVIINAPSIYPLDAQLPVHPAKETHTRHIQEAIIELRKEEAEIGKMTEGQLFKRVHPYTQRIQTYGKFGAEYHVRGPIDPRFVEWAGNCFSKLRARQAILEKRRTMSERTPRPLYEPKSGLKRHSGDEFDRLFKDVKRPFKNLLRPFPSQYEERFKTKIVEIITEVFAEKREAHAKRLSLHKNGVHTP